MTKGGSNCAVITEPCLKCEFVALDQYGLKVCSLGFYPAFVWGKSGCKSLLNF